MAYNSLFLWYREVVHILRVLVITSDRRCFDKTGNRYTHLVWKILQKYVSLSSKTISPSCDPCRASVKTPVQPGSGAGPQIAVYYGWWPIKYDTLKQWCFHCSNVSCFLGSAIALQVSLPARVCLCVAHRGKCQRICRIEARPPCIPAATRRTPDVGTMLDQRRRRWASIVSTSGEWFVFAGHPCSREAFYSGCDVTVRVAMPTDSWRGKKVGKMRINQLRKKCDRGWMMAVWSVRGEGGGLCVS